MNQTPLEELRQAALDHYKELSESNQNYNSFVVDAIKAYRVEEPDQWVSVKDRLPEYNEAVLCVNLHSKDRKPRVLTGHLFRLMQGERSGRIDECEFSDSMHNLYFGGNYWAFPYICHTNFVTHWMPLPTPPKDTNS